MQGSKPKQAAKTAKSPEGKGTSRPANGPSIDLATQAYERIEELFVSMDLQPGSHVRTQDLQSMIGIGRTPVHQAVRRLAAETLLEVRPRNGLRVAPIDLARERHLAILRRDLIRFVTDAAIRNINANETAQLLYLRRELADAADTLTVDGFNEIDKSFDILLIRASGERFLERTLRPLHAIARRIGYLHLTRMSGVKGLSDTVSRHLAIMDCVLAGDAEAAKKGCDELVEFSIALIDEVQKTAQPQWLDVTLVPLTGRRSPSGLTGASAQKDS